MIVVNLMGGLGNQLFQYAAGRALATHLNVELKYTFADEYKLANRALKIDRFNIKADLLTEGEATDYFPKRKFSRLAHKLLGLNYDGRIFREKSYYSHDPAFFSLPNRTYLYGFWQSYGYFSKIEGLIRREFVLRNPSLKYLKVVESIRSLSNPVSIHVRRGDYGKKESGFYLLPQAYYQKASEYIGDKLDKFDPVIFTDDEAWVKNNFKIGRSLVFAGDYRLEDFEELMLMSQCNHHIIANSSYSWWGAWLNKSEDKIVLAPQVWYKLQNPNFNLIPPGWVKIQ
jgi:hypothetical protein